MKPSTQVSPAADVWRRFGGMFGRDAVARKFGEEIPDEWHAMLSRLNEHQIQRGVRMLAYSGKGHVPSLPEFVKLCRDAEHDREVADRPALPNPDSYVGDNWDEAANLHLLGYITRMIPIDPARYGKGPSYMAMKDLMRKDDKVLDASPEFVKAMHILAAYKNAWAQDMRECMDDQGRVPVDKQTAYWKECMRLAEEAITAERAA